MIKRVLLVLLFIPVLMLASPKKIEDTKYNIVGVESNKIYKTFTKQQLFKFVTRAKLMELIEEAERTNKIEALLNYKKDSDNNKCYVEVRISWLDSKGMLIKELPIVFPIKCGLINEKEIGKKV